MASRLEQLNRIAVGIFTLNLFAAGTDLHFISTTQTRFGQSRMPPPSWRVSTRDMRRWTSSVADAERE
jgi:hypothetical protein